MELKQFLKHLWMVSCLKQPGLVRDYAIIIRLCLHWYFIVLLRCSLLPDVWPLVTSQIDTVCMCCCRKAEIRKTQHDRHRCIRRETWKLEPSSRFKDTMFGWAGEPPRRGHHPCLGLTSIYVNTDIYIYIHFNVIHPNKFSSNAQHPWIVIYATLSPSAYVHIYLDTHTCILY